MATHLPISTPATQPSSSRARDLQEATGSSLKASMLEASGKPPRVGDPGHGGGAGLLTARRLPGQQGCSQAWPQGPRSPSPAVCLLSKRQLPARRACSHREHCCLLRLENIAWTGECFSLGQEQTVSWLGNHKISLIAGSHLSFPTGISQASCPQTHTRLHLNTHLCFSHNSGPLPTYPQRLQHSQPLLFKGNSMLALSSQTYHSAECTL